MKRVWFFLISGLLFFSALGSRNTIASLDRAMVHAIGIDRSSEGITVTMQIFRPEGQGSDTQLDAAKANIFDISATAETLTEAMKLCEGRLGEFLFIGHDQVVVLGEGVPASGAEELFSYFLRSRESYLGVSIARAEGKASELLSAELSEGAVTAQNILNILTRHAENGSTVLCTMLDAVSSEGGCTVLPLLELTPAMPEKGSSSEYLMKASGAEVSSGGESFLLTEDECSVLAVLRGSGKKLRLTVEGRSGPETVIAECCCNGTDLSEQGGRISLRYSIELCIQTDQSLEQQFSLPELRSECEREICRRLDSLLSKTVTLHRADALGAAQLVCAHLPDARERFGTDPASILALCDISAEIKCITK